MKQWTHPCQILTFTWLSAQSLLSIERAFQRELEWKFEERVEAGEGGTERRLQLQNRGWSISDAICPPHYFRIRWSPSLSSSGEGDKCSEQRGTLNPCQTGDLLHQISWRKFGYQYILCSPLTVQIKKQLSSGKL